MLLPAQKVEVARVKKFDKQKAFGQHFLNDSKVIQAIVEQVWVALELNPACSLLEIGPGRGALTRPLLEKLPLELSFYVAERDRELIEYWKPESRIKKLLEGDFLAHPDSELEKMGPLVVVSNLPYSAGTAIVVRLAERSAQIAEMILMFQAEVAKRLYAKSSTPDRGSLSLYIQNEWQVDRLLEVKQASFTPPPRVLSEVVRFRKRTQPMIQLDSDEKRSAWNDLLKNAFKHRRKMIKGNFAGTQWQEAFQKSEVSPTLRAESLEWSEWIQIWKQKFHP